MCETHFQRAHCPWFFGLRRCIQGYFAADSRTYSKSCGPPHSCTGAAGTVIAVAGSIARSTFCLSITGGCCACCATTRCSNRGLLDVVCSSAVPAVLPPGVLLFLSGRPEQVHAKIVNCPKGDAPGLMQQRTSLVLQALSDLLALPAAISQHVQQELGKMTGTQAIGLIQPGHCIWHVKRLSQMAPQVPFETFDNSATMSSIECASLCPTASLIRVT